MIKSLNKYGDKLIKTTGLHGADISVQRIDDLDKKAIQYVLKNAERKLKGIDAGCGFGIQSVRFALLNAEMYLMDILNIKSRIQALAKNLFIKDKLFYTQKDIRKIKPSDFPDPVNFLYSQRFIHYLTYAEANKFLSTIASVVKSKGLVFISASGINSELGTNYKGNNCTIEKRYFKLSADIGFKHNILEKICLYSKEEFSALLIQNQFKIREIWESTFGNIKAIAIKQ